MISQGTWRYSKEWEDVTTSRIGIVESNNRVCSVHNNLKPDDEVVSNGHAISAVPEMIDALKKVDAYFDEFTHLTMAQKEVWNDVARALEKAEGKQKKTLQKKD